MNHHFPIACSILLGLVGCGDDAGGGAGGGGGAGTGSTTASAPGACDEATLGDVGPPATVEILIRNLHDETVAIFDDCDQGSIDAVYVDGTPLDSWGASDYECSEALAGVCVDSPPGDCFGGGTFELGSQEVAEDRWFAAVAEELDVPAACSVDCSGVGTMPTRCGRNVAAPAGPHTLEVRYDTQTEEDLVATVTFELPIDQVVIELGP